MIILYISNCIGYPTFYNITSPAPQAMTEQVQGGRVRGITIVKAVVVGNTSTYLGGKRETDGHTHTWAVYLKPFQGEDMSTYVKKVHFKLHDSYSQPMRILSKPPYKVRESGWGEFEIMVKVFFQDPAEKPVSFYHLLKLFPNEHVVVRDKTLISEQYDEIIFTEPTSIMYPLLVNTSPMDLATSHHHNNFEAVERRTFTSIIEARRTVKTEIAELNNRLKSQREYYHSLKQEVKDLEEDAKI